MRGAATTPPHQVWAARGTRTSIDFIPTDSARISGSAVTIYNMLLPSKLTQIGPRSPISTTSCVCWPWFVPSSLLLVLLTCIGTHAMIAQRLPVRELWEVAHGLLSFKNSLPLLVQHRLSSVQHGGAHSPWRRQRVPSCKDVNAYGLMACKRLLTGRLHLKCIATGAQMHAIVPS